MIPFREEDLITTLDYFNRDDLINQVLSETNDTLELMTENQILEKLGQMSEREKLKELNNVLDRGQKRAYSHLMHELKSTNPSTNKYKEIQSKLLEYDKLLFKPRTPVPKIDMSSFALDNQRIGEARTIVGTILEKKQIEVQERIILNWHELHSVKTYGGGQHRVINGYIRLSDDWSSHISTRLTQGYTKEQIINEVETLIKDLDSAMGKMPGLTQDSTIFRACDTFSGTLRPGDISSFKGYGSCSFQEESAKGFHDDGRYMLKILAPKGQKGVAMNAKNDGVRITHLTHEHEFLLPKNQKFQVLEVDHVEKTATIVLL